MRPSARQIISVSRRLDVSRVKTMRQACLLGLLVTGLLTAANACGSTGGNSRALATANVVPSKLLPADTSEPPRQMSVSPSSADAQGSVNGEAFTPRSAIFDTVVINGSRFVVLRLSDQFDDCALMGSSTRRQNSASLVVALYQLDDSGHTSMPQTTHYTMSDDASNKGNGGGFGSAEFSRLDSACTQSLPDDASSAVSGEVSLTSIDNHNLGGTFSLRIGAQADSISGSFSAAACSALGAASRGEAPRNCQ